MMICPHCGWVGQGESDCQHCSAELVRTRDAGGVRADFDELDADSEWITIARFGNAAEAGYFAHELGPVLKCEPRIEYQDDFDAIAGAWRTRYLLTVPIEIAEHGRIQLAAMLEGNWELDQPGPDADDPFCSAEPTVPGRSQRGANSRINWVPIMLTLAAGSAVFWAGRKAPFVRGPVEPRGAGQRDLLDFLADGADPWVQHGGAGGGRRELRINPRGDGATVVEDTDGDGLFDRELHFPMPRADQ